MLFNRRPARLEPQSSALNQMGWRPGAILANFEKHPLYQVLKKRIAIIDGAMARRSAPMDDGGGHPRRSVQGREEDLLNNATFSRSRSPR